jgi:hypothetical protein
LAVEDNLFHRPGTDFEGHRATAQEKLRFTLSAAENSLRPYSPEPLQWKFYHYTPRELQVGRVAKEITDKYLYLTKGSESEFLDRAGKLLKRYRRNEGESTRLWIERESVPRMPATYLPYSMGLRRWVPRGSALEPYAMPGIRLVEGFDRRLYHWPFYSQKCRRSRLATDALSPWSPGGIRVGSPHTPLSSLWAPHPGNSLDYHASLYRVLDYRDEAGGASAEVVRLVMELEKLETQAAGNERP